VAETDVFTLLSHIVDGTFANALLFQRAPAVAGLRNTEDCIYCGKIVITALKALKLSQDT